METFPRYWPFVRGIHRSPVNSTYKGQWRGALIFSLMYAWINSWVNNRFQCAFGYTRVGRAKVNQSKTVQTQSNLNRWLNYTINQKPLTLKKIYEYTLTWKYSSFRNRNIPHPPAYSVLLHWYEGYYTTFRVSKKTNKLWSTQDNKSREFTKNNIPNQAK